MDVYNSDSEQENNFLPVYRTYSHNLRHVNPTHIHNYGRIYNILRPIHDECNNAEIKDELKLVLDLCAKYLIHTGYEFK